MKIEYLIKAIEQNLTKNDDYTGMVSSLNNHVKGALNRFSKKTRGQEHETLAIIDNNGKTVKTIDGDESHVNIDSSGLEGGEYHLEHNHPPYWNSRLPNSLSLADYLQLMRFDGYSVDMETLAPCLNFRWKSITAEGSSNGTRMTLMIADPERFTQVLLDNPDSFIEWANGMCGMDTPKCTVDKYYDDAIIGPEHHVQDWTEQRLKEADEKGVKVDYKKLKEDREAEREKYIKDFDSKPDRFEEYLKEDMRKCREMGLELTVGKLKG